jgi:hypothetical protein
MLFTPPPSAAVDVALAYASLGWFQKLLPVVTNLAAIPAIRYAWRVRLFAICIVYTIAAVVSTYYHACASWPTVACFGLPVSVPRTNDFIWAPFSSVVLSLQLLNFYVYPWASMINYTVLALLFLVQTAAPFSAAVFLTVLLSVALLLLVRVLVLDALAEFVVADEAIPMGDNRHKPLAFDRAERYSWPHLAIGGLLLLIAFPAFAVDAPGAEWLLHSMLWHLGIYLAGYAILVGVTRESPRFFESLRERDGGPPTAPEDPPTFYGARAPAGVGARALEAGLSAPLWTAERPGSRPLYGGAAARFSRTRHE